MEIISPPRPESKKFEWDGSSPVTWDQDMETVGECIRLTMQRYADVGFTGLEGLYENIANSAYFFRKDGEGSVSVTARQINMPDDASSGWEFPMEEAAASQIDPDAKERIAKYRLNEPHKISEISSLAKKKGVRGEDVHRLYRDMWAYARKSGKEVCVALIEEGLDEALLYAFGDALERVGDTFEYEGGRTTPFILHIDSCVDGLYKNYKEVAQKDGESGVTFFKQFVVDPLLDELDLSVLRRHEKDLLRNMGYDL